MRVLMEAVHEKDRNFDCDVGSAVIRHEVVPRNGARKCGSYNLDVGFNPALMPRPYVYECEQCGWQSPEMRRPNHRPPEHAR